MKTPEKVYLSKNNKWLTERKSNEDIEYIRSDMISGDLLYVLNKGIKLGKRDTIFNVCKYLNKNIIDLRNHFLKNDET